MLKETKTEETISFFDRFLSLVTFQFGWAGPLGPPLGYAYDRDKDSITNAKTFDIDYLSKQFNLRLLLTLA